MVSGFLFVVSSSHCLFIFSLGPSVSPALFLVLCLSLDLCLSDSIPLYLSFSGISPCQSFQPRLSVWASSLGSCVSGPALASCHSLAVLFPQPHPVHLRWSHLLNQCAVAQHQVPHSLLGNGWEVVQVQEPPLPSSPIHCPLLPLKPAEKCCLHLADPPTIQAPVLQQAGRRGLYGPS